MAPPLEMKVLAPLIIFTIVFSTVGNLVALIIVLKCKKLRGNLYLINLTATNLVSALLVQGGVLIIRYLRENQTLLCNISMSVFYVSSFVTVLTLTAVALDKYFAIMRPFRYRQLNKKRLSKIVLALSWFCGVVLFIPKLMAMIYTKYGARICSGQTHRSHPISAIELASEITTVALVFLLPNVIICCVYARIIHKLWCGRVHEDGTNIALLRSRRKLTKLSVATTTLFVACWIPFTLDSLYWCLGVYTTKWSQILGMFCVFAYCALSSLIYALFNTVFHDAAISCCKACFSCARGTTRDRGQVSPAYPASPEVHCVTIEMTLVQTGHEPSYEDLDLGATHSGQLPEAVRAQTEKLSG